MPLQHFFLILLVPIVLYEIITVYHCVVPEAKRGVYYATTWFSFFVVIQLILLVYEDVLLHHVFHFSIWMLLFLFYGPFLNLIVSNGQRDHQYRSNAYYFSDFYRIVCVFIFGLFLSLVENKWSYVDESILGIFSIAFLYYGIILRKKIKLNNEILLDKPEQQGKWKKMLPLIVGGILVVVFYLLSKDIKLSVFLLLLFFYVYLTFLRKKMENEASLISNQEEEISNQTEEWKLAYRNKVEDRQSKAQEGHALKYGQTKLNDIVLQRCNIKVNHIIIENKSYLDANFKMTDLASRTKISRYYLAQYFNVVYQMNFREYINKLRIEHVVQYIENHQQKEELSVQDLFLESAFNSKTSFFKSFKHVLGCTPFEFLRKNQ
ncbi:helix-turn-helix domain-containing protein [Myroides sp. TSA_177.3]|uniref:helix-turn-helix domain-containing protein n=1 Tax=Myroides sp. TSA_177.3 TaxID=3415650 RepID=UPI004045A5D5